MSVINGRGLSILYKGYQNIPRKIHQSMFIKLILLFTSMFLFKAARCQIKQSQFSDEIYRSQKKYLQKHIKLRRVDYIKTIIAIDKQNGKALYNNLLKKEPAFFFLSYDTIYIAETYDNTFGNVYGLLWRGEVFFTYTINAVDGILDFNKTEYTLLETSFKDAIKSSVEFKMPDNNFNWLQGRKGGKYYIVTELYCSKKLSSHTISFCLQ